MGKRERKWQQLEEMYGFHIADVLEWFRRYPLRYKDMAAIFNVDVKTLRRWRVALDILPITHDEVIYYRWENTPTDRRAQALNYSDAKDACIDLRLRQGKTRKQAAEILGVHPVTISTYTPGLGLHNMSEEGREVLSRLRTQNNRVPPAPDHPWRH